MNQKGCTICGGSGRDLESEVCEQCNGSGYEGGIVKESFSLETDEHCSCCGNCINSGMKPRKKQLTLPGFEE